MELVCVRHGRTAWNADRRFQGQSDIPLDDEGRAQAQALAAHLQAERFDRAITSDLIRARTTAEAICVGRDLELELEPALREMQFGVWEGLTWPQIVERWPELEGQYESSPRAYTPERAESWEAVCSRVDGVLRRIDTQAARDARVLIVSHAGVMHAMLHVFGNGALRGDDVALRVKLQPASIVRAHGSYRDGWAVDAVNETAAAIAPV